ncbi:Androgen-dependent TFPI-regulating protein [Varanus komodoensis]|nr:Androgen-dependent TFPI-regulating protein [Varanus komodoensis]
MKPSSLFLCHCLGLAWYAFLVHVIRQTEKRGKFDDFAAYGGPWQFLTVLNLVLQAFFYGFSLLADAFVLLKKYRIAKSMFSFRDLIFAGMAFPTSVFVGISFWTLYLYDRELVYPHSIDTVIDIWMNHAMFDSPLPLSKLMAYAEQLGKGMAQKTTVILM